MRFSSQDMFRFSSSGFLSIALQTAYLPLNRMKAISSTTAIVCFAMFAAFSSSRAAAPIAATTGAANVTTTAGTLTGLVTPRTVKTKTWFEWGSTTNYGHVTQTQVLAAGSIAVPVAQSIAGLSPLSNYHFRGVAKNSYGTRRGTNVSFTTAGPPPTAVTGIPTNITTNSLTLVGSANPNGSDTSAFFQWGTSTDYGNVTPAQAISVGPSAVPVQANLSSLVTDLPLHYRLVASNNFGLSYGADQIATPTTALYLYAGESWAYTFHDLPYCCQQLDMGSFGSARAAFHWLANSFAADGAILFQAFENSTNESPIASQTVTSANASGFLLFSGWGYDRQGVVRVTALSGSVVISDFSFQYLGPSSSGVAPFWANGIQATRLPQPALLAAQFVTNVLQHSALVIADINARNLSSGVLVQWGSTTNYGFSSGVTNLNFDYAVRCPVVVSNLAPHTLFHLRVVVTNSAGTTYGDDLVVTTPTSVATLPASDLTANSATLNALAFLDGVATSGFFEWGLTTNYDQSTASQGVGAGSGATNFSAAISGLSPNTTYHVRAVTYALGFTNRAADVLFTTRRIPTNTTITNLASQDVRGAIERGGTITFAYDGVVSVSNQFDLTTDAVIDASGRSITFDGNGATRLFAIHSGVTLALTNVLLTNGRSTNGGAIYNDGGTLIAEGCRFVSNCVIGLSGANGIPGTNAEITATPADLKPGQAGGDGMPGGDAYGGGIYNRGSATFRNCIFLGNTARGGSGGQGGEGGDGGWSPPFRPRYSSEGG